MTGQNRFGSARLSAAPTTNAIHQRNTDGSATLESAGLLKSADLLTTKGTDDELTKVGPLPSPRPMHVSTTGPPATKAGKCHKSLTGLNDTRGSKLLSMKVSRK